MAAGQNISPAVILDYLHSRPRWERWMERVGGRRYLVTRFGDRRQPLLVIAHSFRDARAARQVSLALEQDWLEAPAGCRETYEGILGKAPGVIVLQLRRKNLCGCLGHRHPFVTEKPFASPPGAFRGVGAGEMDIAWARVGTWHALPLSDTALDVKFLEGSRLEEFHAKQFRLKLLSVILHEVNHLVCPQEPEAGIRERSIAFYHDSTAAYVEDALATLSLTIDRSFSRLG
ncbi:MAG: hypothetical protein ACRD1N_02110 [Terriglobia bacterium]